MNTEKVSDMVKDIPGDDDIKSIEENQNLMRRWVFLQQQLEEKDRRIKMLETLVAGGENRYVAMIDVRKNSAAQVLIVSLTFS